MKTTVPMKYVCGAALVSAGLCIVAGTLAYRAGTSVDVFFGWPTAWAFQEGRKELIALRGSPGADYAGARVLFASTEPFRVPLATPSRTVSFACTKLPATVARGPIFHAPPLAVWTDGTVPMQLRGTVPVTKICLKGYRTLMTVDVPVSAPVALIRAPRGCLAAVELSREFSLAVGHFDSCL